ncbi:unnamed protein product [Peniophora sp. CBMAI 1063]|nr:unnamed protein product [Peniophora sp. CBMAI 1063]
MEDAVALVIDTGSYMCKAGFAGEDAPRVCFPTVVGRPSGDQENDLNKFYIGDEAQSNHNTLTLTHPVHRRLPTDWDSLETLWHHTLHTSLRAHATEHPILLAEPPLTPASHRETAAQIMFESLGAPAYYAANQAVLALYAASARTTGVVFDAGYEVAHVVPVYEGLAITHATVGVDVGGRHVTDALCKGLAERGYEVASPDAREIVREVKEKLGYVALDFDEEVRTAVYHPGRELSYELPDGKVLDVRHERFKAPEALFNPSLIGLSSPGAPQTIHNSIAKCDPDLHRFLYKNIALCGGTTMFAGLADRMHKELSALAPGGVGVKVVERPERKYAAWIGGSILGSLSTFAGMWVGRGEWEEVGGAIVHRMDSFTIATIQPQPKMSTTMKDGRQRARLEAYTAHWKKDSAKETGADHEARNESYTDVVNGYYDGATELYEWGWAKSFHFSRFYAGEAFDAALARHEHYLAAQMSLRPGMRVLDVGCGVGGPARQIANFADVTVVGVNNNAFQVGRARRYTRDVGLDAEGRVRFVRGDFMRLAEIFGEGSFDAVYAIEATVHAPSLEGVYGEIMKVLKPGGVFGVYEWAMTDAWDPTIPAHKDLAHRIELGDGIPEMRPLSSVRSAIRSVGFEIEHEEDLAARDDEVPWYYPLEGDLRKAQTTWDLFTVWRLSRTGKLITHTVTWLAEMVGLAPRGTTGVSEALMVAAEALVEGGRTRLFTPMYLVVSRKPSAS